MADNLTTPLGLIRTNDVGGAHFQGIKIGIGTAGAFDGWASATTPLPVTLLATETGPIVASANYTRPSNTTQYAPGDSYNATAGAAVLTFTGVVRATGKGGRIIGANFLSTNNTITTGVLVGTLYVFTASPTPTADNAAIVLSAANMASCVAAIPFAMRQNGGVQFADVQYVKNFVTAGSANLFGLVSVDNAYTPISAEVLTAMLHCEPIG